MNIFIKNQETDKFIELIYNGSIIVKRGKQQQLTLLINSSTGVSTYYINEDNIFNFPLKADNLIVMIDDNNIVQDIVFVVENDSSSPFSQYPVQCLTGDIK